MNIHDLTKGQTVVVPILQKIHNKNILPFEFEFRKVQVFETDIVNETITLIETFGDRHGLMKFPVDAVFFNKEEAIKEILHELEIYTSMFKEILEKETAK